MNTSKSQTSIPTSKSPDPQRFTMSSPQQAITFKLSCHCGNFTHTLSIPSSSFPLKSSVCHCTTCRQVSGHVFGTFAVIPLPYPTDGLPALPTSGLVAYNKSPGLTRWFCGTCGASCWNDDRSTEEWEWEVATGVIDSVETDGRVRLEGIQGLLRRVQMYVGDTKDGGAAVWVNGGVLDGMDRRTQGRSSSVLQDEALLAMTETTTAASQSEQVLLAQCACAKVQFEIRKDETGSKYSAGIDACESCRKVSGFEITGWVTVPKNCVFMGGNRKLDLDADCFRHYRTSERVDRTFCTGCGATVFAEIQGRTTIDIGVGLLLAEEGVRADSWLKWDKYGIGQVAYVEDAIDKAFVDGMVRERSAAKGK